jgi:UDP-3-O-[3-hydroxymyristoyl] N-acetylglucosamine deacetylase / 3-hydroxyacyl-[acyl-carrier-protein] dehydratase
MNQRTIGKEITIKGVGLHTGRKCKAVFKPAPANSGIRFIRVDLPGTPVFPAHIDYVVDIIRGTTLGVGDERVYTIEHILSSLTGLGIDNISIELDDNEPPVLDGSAKGFAEAFIAAGIEDQDAMRNYFTVTTPVEYVANQTVIRIEPADFFEIVCDVDYNHPMISNQKFVFRLDDNYAKEIAPARTFCFDYEIEALKKKGLAKGGSLDNAIVIGPTGIYNPGAALRFDNEFVRHKILDLMGDLTLIGSPLKARVTATRCGHGHNIKFLRQLLEKQPTVPSVVRG